MDKYRQKLAELLEQQIIHLTPLNGGNRGSDIIMDPHQQDALELATISLLTNNDAFSIVHSCGSGKTILEGSILAASQRAKSELGLADTQDIIVTTQRALIHSVRCELENLGLDVGIWGGGKKQLDRPIVLASVQILQRRDTMGRLSKDLPIDRIPLIIGDEADQFLTGKRRNLIQRFSNALKIGLTATPKWPDERDISDLWGEKIHKLTLKDAILKGVNVPPMFMLFEANLDDSHLTTFAGDYENKTLCSALKEAELQKAIPEVYKSLVPENARKDYPTIVYVPNVNLVEATVESLRESLGNSVTIHSWTGETTTTNALNNDITDFNNGKIDILVLCEMGGRGVNLPRARCLIDTYPTLSANKLEQRHGRVLRRIRHDSALEQQGYKKPFALIAQIIPKSVKYRPYLLPDLLDCWPDFKAGRLLGVSRNSSDGGTNPDAGAPVQEEVRTIRENILRRNPSVYVKKVEEINIYEELQIREDMPKSDMTGFFKLNGTTYGTMRAWGKKYDKNHNLLSLRLNNKPYILGLHKKGKVLKFYSKETFLEAIEDTLEDLPQVDETGFFIKNNERYGSLLVWQKLLGISRPTIKYRIDKIGNLHPIKGRNTNGIIFNYYSETEIKELCADLIVDMPKANDEDYFILDGEKYKTMSGWAFLSRMGQTTIQKRLEGKKWISGKDRLGRICEFYSESTVKEVDDISCNFYENCRADEKGFFIKDGMKYGTKSSWAEYFNIKLSSIDNRLRFKKPIQALKAVGFKTNFYSEEIILECCKDLIEGKEVRLQTDSPNNPSEKKRAEISTEIIPRVDKKGFAEYKGEKYGFISSWADFFKVSPETLYKKKGDAAGIKCLTPAGKYSTRLLFKESDIRAWLGNLILDMPKADKNGFLIIDNIRYASPNIWEKELGISETTISLKLKNHTGLTAKTHYNQIVYENFYPEELVRMVLADLIDDIPEANKDGFIEIDGERYGTINFFADEYKTVYKAVKSRIEGLVGITGRTHNKRTCKNGFYKESEVKKRCADLLADVPAADENGFLFIDGKRYATIHKWSELLGVDHITIKRRLGKNAVGVTGRTRGKGIGGKGFYEEEQVREALGELLLDIQSEDEEGRFILNGVLYKTIGGWANFLGVADKTIRSRLKNIVGITVKSRNGRVIKNGYYDELTIRKVCSELFK